MKRLIVIVIVSLLALTGCKKETIIIKEPCKHKGIHPDTLQKWFRMRLIMGGKR